MQQELGSLTQAQRSLCCRKTDKWTTSKKQQPSGGLLFLGVLWMVHSTDGGGRGKEGGEEEPLGPGA